MRGRKMGSYYHGLLVQPDCSRCPLRHKKKVFPDGNLQAKLAVVGEAPGFNEERQGRGFIGASGQLLWQLLEQAGIRREDVWVSNAALCMDERVKLESGAVISRDEVRRLANYYCRTRLLQELQIINPRATLAVGNWALRSLSGVEEGKILNYRGSIITTDLDRRLSQELGRKGRQAQ
jgi:DNA polymerase